MRIGSIRKALVMALAAISLLPMAAYAQSAFTGVVKDTSGAVLPGVTVEVASDALIEKTRSVVTDADGGYRVVDLRPGTYTLTYSLEGFSTVKRDAVQLPSDFTMTINTEMRVGALEETLTVTGAAPTVDVQSTTKSQVLNREALDAIPTGRTIQGMGQLITGVSLNAPDVGGSRAMQQTYMSAHGAGASQTTVQVDGLLVNGLDVDGAVQNYFNSSMSQEMVYTTSGAGADVAGGGVRLNMIPRDGGNQVSGSLFLGYQNESFQADNITDDLIARGVRTADGIGKLANVEGAMGGPIKKDKVWFFASARNFILDTLPANTFYGQAGTGSNFVAPTPTSEKAVDPQSIRSVQARITWQMSQKNKLAVYNDRLLKNRGSAMTAGFDPATAGIVWNSPIYTTGSIKFTSTLSNTLFLETGFSTNFERYNTMYQEGLFKERGTPEWYSVINRTDTARGTAWGAGAGYNGMYPDRLALMAALSYVTGTHNVKVGIQDNWGSYRNTRLANGDLRAQFNNGVPFQVTILNTPVDYMDKLKADFGIFAQDSWTLKRLTVNYGARWELFAHGIPEETSPAGRFVGARTFGPIDMPTWKSIAPRAGIVYDLFGNQKTALKASFGKYMQAGTVGFSQSQNPLLLTTQNVAWNDLNGDGNPQGELGCVYLTPGCEINVAGNATTARQLPANFGVVSPIEYASDIKRMYNVEMSGSIQHEIVSGVSVTAGWYRREYFNLRRRFNTGVTASDFTPFTLYSPIDGSPITYYNVSSAKVSQLNTNLVDQNAPNRTMKYNGFEYNFSARLGKGITLFGGGMSERMLTNTCDNEWNPNLQLYCDQSQSGLPFRTQFKIAGSVPLKYGINFGVAFQSLPGYVYGTTAQYALTGVSGPSGITTNNPPAGQGSVWLVTRTTRYTADMPCAAQGKCTAGALVNPAQTQASLNVPLVAPMTEFGDRINQLDFNVTKNIKIGRFNIQPKLDIFNVLNVASVTSVQGLNFGTAAYMRPSVILNPRTIQIGANVRF
ncbi:MAG: carboxypeptidase regulatory-like domain-containing protein [Vicinamibacterales bacterium]